MEIWTIQEDNGCGWVLLREAYQTEQEALDRADWLKANLLPDAVYKIRPVRIEGLASKPPQ